MAEYLRECHAAIDLGASSGRVVVGWLEHDDLLRTEEVHRFENGQARVHGHDCWKIGELFEEILEGLALCKARGFTPKTVAIDSWGVDFALLDAEDRLIGDVVAYRDSRTDGMYAVADALVAPEVAWERTGIQRSLINTVYQLLALSREAPEQLAEARSLLMVPDYLGFLLTGVKAHEYTNATTTGLVNARGRAWDAELIRAYGFPERLFGELSFPGTTLGPVKAEVAERIGYATEVVLVASHDTGSAYVAATERDSLILSSGTWSLLGVELPEPELSAAARDENFTNEGGYAKTYRFLKNIMGLWMIQSVRRELNGVAYVAGREDVARPLSAGIAPLELEGQVDFGDLIAVAQGAPRFPSLVDVDDDCFLAPASMMEAVCAWCASHAEPIPQTVGELMTCVYHSLTSAYERAIHGIETITNHRYQAISLVGGGCQDAHLNQLTANETGKTVIAGPIEATSAGNLVVQMIAAGGIPSLAIARRIIANSSELVRFDPA